MNILFITYIDFDGLYSGARLRPQKMLEAFKEKGHEVYVIKGQQNRYKERNAIVYSFMKKLNQMEFDLCYIESPPGPIFNYLDFLLIKKIKKRNIPIFFYCRDIFWLFFEKTNRQNILKDIAIYLLNRYQVHIYRKFIDKVYFATSMAKNEFNKIFKLENSDVLSAGCVALDVERYENKKRTGIYVGTASSFYGTDMLIETYILLNQEDVRYNLILVCPESDYRLLFRNELKFPWLKVYHTSGSDLINLYKQADFGIIPIRRSLYADMAYPIKMFDYISNELPIISTNIKMVDEFIRRYDIGITCDANPDSLAISIKEFYKNKTGEKIRGNILFAKNDNLWTRRVDKVLYDTKNC